MIYNTISSKVCIARVFDRFNIDYSGFINRVPVWIHQALGELDVYLSLQSNRIEGTVVAYKCAIPTGTKLIEYIEYDGYRLRRLTSLNEAHAENMAAYDTMTSSIEQYPNESEEDYLYRLEHMTQVSSRNTFKEGYEISNGFIVTTFEEGTIWFYTKSIPVVYDSTNRVYFPSVPDNEAILEALDWYILKRLLERGHNIANYSLKDNNPYTNPAMAWDLKKKSARNSAITMDADERHEISKMIRSLITNNTYYYDEEVNLNTQR
jgi:hypothetical protein